MSTPMPGKKPRPSDFPSVYAIVDDAGAVVTVRNAEGAVATLISHDFDHLLALLGFLQPRTTNALGRRVHMIRYAPKFIVETIDP